MKTTMFLSTCLLSSFILLIRFDHTVANYNATAGACALYQPAIGTCTASGVSDVGDIVGRLLNGQENYALVEFPQNDIYFLLAVDYQSIPAVTAALDVQAIVAFILNVKGSYYAITTIGCGSVVPVTDSQVPLERLDITLAAIYKGLMLINQQYPSECNLFASITGTRIDFANCINAVIAPCGLSSSQVASNVQSTIKKYGYNVKTQSSMLGTCIQQPQTTPGLQATCNIKNSATDLALRLSLSNLNPSLLISPSSSNTCRYASAMISILAKTPQLQTLVVDFKVVIYERSYQYMVYLAGYLPQSAPLFYYQELINAC